ncbi:MAG: hypothetical protein M0R06_27050 [Sphaerochaeta sp.]|jgi:hypothetical protein|nr:hypothetical protein [Sphaerochaeta sp.]
MAGEDKAMTVAAVGSTISAIAAAILLARKPVSAAANEFPPEVLEILSAIAQGEATTIEQIQQIINLIGQQGQPGGGSSSGYPPNATSIAAFFVNCPLAQPNAYQLPALQIPEGMRVALLARNPLGVNGGIIYVGKSQVDAGGNTQAWPLPANATISYRITNSNQLWIGATVAGEGVYVTVEQMGG